jgi:hypothetical protein
MCRVLLAFVLLLCLAAPSFGIDDSAKVVAEGESFLDEIARLDAQIRMLRKRQEFQQVMRDVLNKSVGVGVPSVLAVYGIKGQLWAELILDGGVRRLVKVHDVLPGGLRIVRISRWEVVAQKGETRIPLQFIVSPGLPTRTVQPEKRELADVLVSAPPEVKLPSPEPRPDPRVVATKP